MEFFRYFKFAHKRIFQISIIVCLFLFSGTLVFLFQKRQIPHKVSDNPVMDVVLPTPSNIPLVIQSESTVQEELPTLDSEEWKFLELLNAYRATFGAPPLKVSVTLTRAAKWMVADMITQGRLSHQDSLGRMPEQRLPAFGYSGGGGENALFGANSAQAALEQFRDACDGDANGNNCTYAHRENMKNARYSAIGIARQASSPYFWTTDFGYALDQELVKPATIPTSTPVPSSGSPTNTPVPSSGGPTATPIPTLPPAATPTPLPDGTTQLKISIHVSGIASTPQHNTISVKVALNDTSNHEAINTTATAVYKASSSSYDVAVPLTSVPDGFYTAKIQLPNTLWRAIPQVIHVVAHNTALTEINLISGEINNDNEINVSDFTLITDCVGKKTSCSSGNATKADLNDDGKVDILDINILLTSLAKRSGD